MNITTCSVRVLRSWDYCHFEVTLGAQATAEDAIMKDGVLLADIDNLRKEAARLADKAVSQYKIAKANRLKLARETIDRGYEIQRIDRIKAIAEGDRTPEQQAALKVHADEVWEASRRFDYEDDWQDDEESDS